MLSELVLTDDAVLVSYVEALLRDGGIRPIVLDRHISALHGAVGRVPQRIMVASDDWPVARMLLVDAGLAAWITSRPPQ